MCTYIYILIYKRYSLPKGEIGQIEYQKCPLIKV